MTGVGFCLLAALASGCASNRHFEATLARAGDETAPDFLTGPASALFAKVDAFSAHVSAGSGAPGAQETKQISGILIGRQGRLIFQPAPAVTVKKGTLAHGGMFFIWDLHTGTGYVLSDALQGFAPISTLAQMKTVEIAPKAAEPENVNGHPCRRAEATVTLTDGSTAALTLWRADDASQFPMRIETKRAAATETLDFTDVRFDVPSPELFSPPVGFTPYASASALMNELMIRQSSMKKGPTSELGEPPPANSGMRAPSAY